MVTRAAALCNPCGDEPWVLVAAELAARGVVASCGADGRQGSMPHATLLVLLLLMLLGCATPSERHPGGALGSVSNPVRCDGKPGELAYLARLRCPSGAAPHFHFRRRGPRTRDGHETDEFELRCVRDNRSTSVSIDRHHPRHVEREPVPGFAFQPMVEGPSFLRGSGY